MPKSKDQKKQILQDLSKKIARAKSIIFTKFNSLGVKENEDLRNRLRAANSEYYVAKKTLLNIAFKDSLVKELNTKSFDGQVAAVFGYNDEVAPAKIVDTFKKDKNGKIEFLGGILENKYITATLVSELAKLPSREELYGKIVGSINAPVSGFVNALVGNLRNLVGVFKAIGEKSN